MRAATGRTGGTMPGASAPMDGILRRQSRSPAQPVVPATGGTGPRRSAAMRWRMAPRLPPRSDHAMRASAGNDPVMWCALREPPPWAGRARSGQRGTRGQTGISECFLRGRSSRLLASMRRARMSRSLVSGGRMTAWANCFESASKGPEKRSLNSAIFWRRI